MKRIITGLGALLAVLCFIGCLAVVNWMWSVKKPAYDKTARAFEKADEVLVVAEKTIDNVKENLERSRNHMRLVQTSAGPVNDRAGYFERSIARVAAKQISPNVNDVQHSLEKVTEASIVINSILESLHDIEGVENLDNNQVRDLQSKIDGVTRASMDLGSMLDDPRDRPRGESAAERSERIAANLDMVIQLAIEFQKGVVSLRKKVQFYRGRSLSWIEEGPTYASVILGWIMLSQAVVAGVAVRATLR